jgi:hypothetical protein
VYGQSLTSSFRKEPTVSRIHTGIIVAAVIFGALLTTAGVANAASEYTTAMKAFLPVIVEWTAEVQGSAHAAALKPEPARLSELDELAAQGYYILDDIRGTAELAPAPLGWAHWQLADAIGSIAGAAEGAEEDPVGAAETINAQMSFLEPALGRIQNHVQRYGVERPGVVPHVPGANGS